MHAVLRGDVVFVPDEVPRRGRIAFWGGGGDDALELVFPGGTYGVRKRTVRATFLGVAEALPLLLATRDDDVAGAWAENRSLQAWSAAAVAGVGLLARGRLMPTVTPAGLDAWRVGPLDDADLRWLDQLAAAFPTAGHALAVPGSRPMRLHSPQWLVRRFWDALADTLVRSGAAALRGAGSPMPAPRHDLNGSVSGR